jgi:hypothetical protein
MLLIGGAAAWGQSQKDSAGSAEKSEKVDRAAAYFYFTLAHHYAELAVASGGRNREYAEKAMENYQAAIKADPKLAEIYPNGPRRRFTMPVSRPPASRQDRLNP